jgi:hypothetical protein
MHTKPMSESQGRLGDEKPAGTCPKCNNETLVVQTWDSSCGGYEDYKYSCKTPGCGHTHWIDGIDS